MHEKTKQTLKPCHGICLHYIDAKTIYCEHYIDVMFELYKQWWTILTRTSHDQVAGARSWVKWYLVEWGKKVLQPSWGKKGSAHRVHSNCTEFNLMEEYVRAIIACHCSVCFNPILQIMNVCRQVTSSNSNFWDILGIPNCYHHCLTYILKWGKKGLDMG
jgi:hypothetical protein